jgi:regulator of replication initiation timing
MKDSHKKTIQVLAMANYEKLILSSAALALLFVGGLLALSDKTASSATSSGFAIILLFIANIDRFASFKGFGVEAITRELDDKIAEAAQVKTRLEEVITKNSKLTEEVESLSVKLATISKMVEEAQKLKEQVGEIYQKTKINYDTTEDLRLKFNEDLERLKSSMGNLNLDGGIV